MNTSTQEGRYSLEDFIEIMHRLRGPGGCEWDRQQTHGSIRREFIEECYEAVEAIDNEDAVLLREELGDVFLQVMFHSIIEEEKGVFTFYDVIDDISKKMVIRHPHVFSDINVNSVDEILTNWDSIKKETKGQKSDKEMLQSVTKAMPALMRSQKIQKKAAKLGVQMPCDLDTNQRITEESVGRLLAQVVKIALDNGIDAEKALYAQCDRFIDENF